MELIQPFIFIYLKKEANQPPTDKSEHGGKEWRRNNPLMVATTEIRFYLRANRCTPSPDPRWQQNTNTRNVQSDKYLQYLPDLTNNCLNKYCLAYKRGWVLKKKGLAESWSSSLPSLLMANFLDQRFSFPEILFFPFRAKDERDRLPVINTQVKHPLWYQHASVHMPWVTCTFGATFPVIQRIFFQ